jgi:hypothetical protein
MLQKVRFIQSTHYTTQHLTTSFHIYILKLLFNYILTVILYPDYTIIFNSEMVLTLLWL